MQRRLVLQRIELLREKKNNKSFKKHKVTSELEKELFLDH